MSAGARLEHGGTTANTAAAISWPRAAWVNPRACSASGHASHNASKEEKNLIRAVLSDPALAQALCNASATDLLAWVGSLSPLLQAQSRDVLMAAAAVPLLRAWQAAAAAAAGGGGGETCRLLLLAADVATAQAAAHLGIQQLELQPVAASRSTESASRSDASFNSESEPTFSSTGAEKNVLTFGHYIQPAQARGGGRWWLPPPALPAWLCHCARHRSPSACRAQRCSGPRCPRPLPHTRHCRATASGCARC